MHKLPSAHRPVSTMVGVGTIATIVLTPVAAVFIALVYKFPGLAPQMRGGPGAAAEAMYFAPFTTAIFSPVLAVAGAIAAWISATVLRNQTYYVRLWAVSASSATTAVLAVLAFVWWC